MPLPMVHLSVTHALIEADYFTASSAIYVGSLSPDAIHQRAGFTRQDKAKTHFRTVEGFDIERILSCVENDGSEQDLMFSLGYVIHLLTDYYWQRTIFMKFNERYEQAKCPKKDIKEAYYNDTDVIDLYLYNTVTWRDQAWDLLKSFEPCGFQKLLSSEEIQDWNQRTIQWFENFDWTELTECKYITIEEVESFVIVCRDFIIEMFRTR